MSQRFAIDVKNSPGRYLHSNYSTEELIAGVSYTRELEIYLEAIKDDIS